MKHLYTIILALLCVTSVQAQMSDDEYDKVRQDLNRMFIRIHKGTVPTGYLLDYGVDLLDLSDYDGTELTDSNLVSYTVYKDILKSIVSCDMSRSTLPDIDDVMESFYGGPDVVNVGFAAFRYNYIKANALEDNLIGYDEDSGQVSYVYNNGVRQNPYSESVLFAFSPDRESFPSLSVKYMFPAASLYTNLGITRVEFNAGDGAGYRQIMAAGSYPVTYGGAGPKELRLRIRTVSGQVYEAHSVIEVTNAVTPNYAPSEPEIPPTDSLFFYSEYDGQTTIKAQVSYYCIPGNSTITRPFIVAEGFDPWIFDYLDKDIPDVNVHLGYTNHIQFYKHYWGGAVLKNKYDLIYIDWDNSLVDIRANAELLVQIIEHINQMKSASGSSEKNIVMGQSMGGLITRYALRSMELDGEPHDVKTFISHDSPHHGANVPLGALYFIRQALSFVHGFDTAINIYDLFTEGKLSTAEERLYSVLNAQSVKQMLVNYVSDAWSIDNSVHEAWQDTLDVCGFPVYTENIAIINGRQYDKSATLGSGGHLFYLSGYAKTELATDLLGFVGGHCLWPFMVADVLSPLTEAIMYLGSTRLNVHAEINPLSSSFAGMAISRLNVNYVKKFLWIFPKTYNLHSSSYYTPANANFYDDYPGSQYLFYNFGGPKEVIDTVYNSAENVWGNYSFEYKVGDRFMFIPTASALAINSDDDPTSSQYMRDYFTSRPVPESETPFSAYMLAENAEKHIELSANTLTWLDLQLGTEISGPDTLSVFADYTLTGYTGPVQWSSSDNTKATIDSNGRLTVVGNGFVTVTAELSLGNQTIRKTKDVMTGFPDVAITYNFSPGSGHMFVASVLDNNDKEKIDALVQAGEMQYEWSILCDESDMTTTVGASPSITHLPKEDETVTVCLRLVDSRGCKGDTYTRTINLRNPFSVNYSYVEVDQNGNVRFIKENGYEVGTPLSDFSITFRNIIYTSYDNASTLGQKYIQGNVCYLAYVSGTDTVYLQGTKLTLQNTWVFDFLESTVFVNALEDVIEDAGTESLTPGTIVDFGLWICNTPKKMMQRLPFAIIYKEI